MSTSMGVPMDRAGGGGFRTTRRGRIGDNLATDKGGGRVETVLGDAEEAECNTD